jgi:hypothetical protein
VFVSGTVGRKHSVTLPDDVVARIATARDEHVGEFSSIA